MDLAKKKKEEKEEEEEEEETKVFNFYQTTCLHCSLKKKLPW